MQHLSASISSCSFPNLHQQCREWPSSFSSLLTSRNEHFNITIWLFGGDNVSRIERTNGVVDLSNSWLARLFWNWSVSVGTLNPLAAGVMMGVGFRNSRCHHMIGMWACLWLSWPHVPKWHKSSFKVDFEISHLWNVGYNPCASCHWGRCVNPVR